ncbi:hypothetical protein BCR36DRAFT_412498 [Piromyces finnis]|uniref:CCD97-like C-terminal domain-containing protein n=1 Tax=Piromyces finnis TaxID=1754191 RepID=A0A1Y1V9X8_9FUNG|nr:hypothetical protein BCR36DRAFT_412498 [Piromyces finnis]|eukprot:ORX50001.1 hypothetical protein BCR36DRAFT_412498 [Piromyces finnis]
MTKNINTNIIDDEIIDNLVNHIISLKVDLKSRRYDEEVQTDNVKEQWLKKTLKNDPALFLEKWGKHLKQSDLDYFDPLKNDYEIAYHLKMLKKNIENTKTQNLSKIDSNLSNKIIRNRRYNYIQKHPEYFTLENLQERNPYEYEEYIGQYIPEDKRVEYQPFQNNMTLVERMYFDIDHQRMNDEIEEMEDILYQEEEKEKAEDERDNELIIKKEKTKEIKNIIKDDKNNIEEKNEELSIKNNSINNNEGVDFPIVPLPSKEEINEDDILKLSDKNKKFYQIMNSVDDESDFVEEEDDSDEEYNEETIMKEIERRRELKKKEELLKKKQESSYSISDNSNNIKGKKTKIRIINPAYYDNKNNLKIKEDESKPMVVTSSLNDENKSRIQSVEDIFNVKENDNDKNENKTNNHQNIKEQENGGEEEEEDDISEELKQYYYNEFVNIMKKEFIDGNDKNFDYSIVDNCEDYDDYQIYEQDIHEQYFEDNDDLFYPNNQNMQKRYYDKRFLDDMDEENYFDYD